MRIGGRRLEVRLALAQRAWLARGWGRFALGRGPRHPPPEIHAFLLWSHARSEEGRILRDLGERFSVKEVVEVAWDEADFSWNLARFYGGLLPPGHQKELHCGTGPFLVVVVEDPSPAYAPRPTPKGIVNRRTFDAKQRYRSWTGGGHRVHATLDPAEAEHDLYLLLGRRSDHYRARSGAWDGHVERRESGVLGASGWQDFRELLSAVEVATTYVLLAEPDGRAASGLTLLVGDRVRAALTANARPLDGAAEPAQHEATVGGRALRLELREAGGGRSDRTLLRDRVRDGRGVFVPASG